MPRLLLVTVTAATAAAIAVAGCGSDHPDVPIATAPTTTLVATSTSTASATTAPTTTTETTPPPTEATDASQPTDSTAATATTTEEGDTSVPPPTTAAPETTASVPPADPNEFGLRAVVDQFREDEILHLLQVRVTNTSQVKVRIMQIQLVWPGLTVVAPTVRSDLLSPGQTLDVPIDYGVAVCSETPPGVDETPPDAPAVAAATVKIGDSGPVVPTYIPIADQLHIFNRIFGPSCRDQRIQDVAKITFGPTWTEVTEGGVPGLAGTIVMERNNGNEPVTLTDMGGSVLLSVHAARESAAALATLAPGRSRLEVPIVFVESGNCFPHALAESKKTFILPAQVSLNGEPPLTYELTIDVADRSQFGQMINESCGVG
jgi:hypothetical protein